MKHAGIEIRIGRLVVDASQRATSADLADAVGEALQSELATRAPTQEPAASQWHAPRIIARRIATGIAGPERFNMNRGRNGAD
ncbi:hypothetical protein JQ543_01890 [Bradyrhizobium diazoefficiens]|nr:hypothetical protein [Bradyrhizobium diazoefficiens]MBR0846479.1 hypothetical protein [Bradyrhizobium diazoefficiens]